MSTPCRSFCVVNTLYELAFIDGRLTAGLKVSYEEDQWRSTMARLFPGDGQEGRRQHQRVQITAPADLSADGQRQSVVLLDMSAGGVGLHASAALPVDTQVLLRVGRVGTVQYSFPMRVRRSTQHCGAKHLGLSMAGIPIKLQHGGVDPSPGTCQCLIPPPIGQEL